MRLIRNGLSRICFRMRLADIILVALISQSIGLHEFQLSTTVVADKINQHLLTATLCQMVMCPTLEGIGHRVWSLVYQNTYCEQNTYIQKSLTTSGSFRSELHDQSPPPGF